MEKTLRIVILEDKAADAELMIREVQRAGFIVEWRRVATEADFLAELANPPDLILSDYNLPRFDGVRAVVLLREHGLDTPFILISGAVGEDAAVEAMKLGADDFLLKDRIARLGPAIEHVLEAKWLRKEHKRAQEILRASEARYHGTLESILEACQLIGFDWTYLYLNGAAAVHNRRPNSELLGRKMTDVWPGIEATGVFALLRRCMEERIPLHQEVEFVFPDGVKGWFDVRSQPVPEGIFVLSINVSERRCAEAKVRESAAQLQTIVENVNEAIVVSDLNGQLLQFNRVALDLLGYSGPEEGRRHLSELADTFELAGIDGTPWPVSEWPLARILRGERLRDVEGHMRRINEDWRRVFSFGGNLALDAAGKPLMAVVTFSDITERKLAADKIRQLNTDLEQRVVERTAQLVTANNELESFSYSVSHDLRAPLRSIDGFTKAILEDYSGKLDAEGQDYLNRIRANSQRMGHLIDDLLNLARVARAEMTREAVDLSRIARDIADELRETAPERDAQFVIADGLVANADTRLMRIVLTNLLGNAWKFTSRRSCSRIEFGRAIENETTAYFTRDNGAGFDAEYAGKLFGAFQRLHSTVEYPGTGIGLATVQRIIHRHGGRIWADGAVDQGATFHFTL